MYQYRVLDILRVLDGDTIDSRIDLGFGLQANLRFRVAGVDCPELNTPEGKVARDFTAAWLTWEPGTPCPFVIHTFKGAQSALGIGDGAFGRWLGAVFRNGASLAFDLTQAGHTK